MRNPTSHGFDFLPEELYSTCSLDELLEEAYRVYKNDFLDQKIFLRNLPILTNRRKFKANDQFEETFWHIVTKDSYIAEKRQPLKSRIQKMPWVRSLIENFQHVELKYWCYLEGSGRIRHYIWAEEIDYVVILEEKRERLFLITAFNIHHSPKRKNLTQKYEKRL
jgi:hypothetical protein